MPFKYNARLSPISPARSERPNSWAVAMAESAVATAWSKSPIAAKAAALVSSTEASRKPVSSVTLSASNGYQASVTVSGVSNNIVEGTRPFQITTEAASSADISFAGLDPSDVVGTVMDSTVAAAVTVIPASSPLIVSEDGTSSTVDYVLSAEPSADVTFDLLVTDPNEGSLNQSTLVFTPANWGTPQTVTITGLDESDVDGDQAFQIVAAPTETAQSATPASSQQTATVTFS